MSGNFFIIRSALKPVAISYASQITHSSIISHRTAAPRLKEAVKGVVKGMHPLYPLDSSLFVYPMWLQNRDRTGVCRRRQYQERTIQ